MLERLKRKISENRIENISVLSLCQTGEAGFFFRWSTAGEAVAGEGDQINVTDSTQKKLSVSKQ